MKQGWMQTLGGLTILVIIPVLTILCLTPDVHNWIRTSIAGQFRSEDSPQEDKSSGAAEMMKQYRLPDSISKIAQVSEAEPDFSETTPVQPSGVSHAMLRLRRALQAYPNRRTPDIFRAVNSREAATKAVPCPFERINGEQSVILGQDGQRHVSLTETLNRCAAAVEQTAGEGH